MKNRNKNRQVGDILSETEVGLMSHYTPHQYGLQERHNHTTSPIELKPLKDS